MSVSVLALAIRHATRTLSTQHYHIWLVWLYHIFSPHLSHTRHDFGGGEIALYTKVRLYLLLQLLSETFLILRSTICPCVKYRLFLSAISGIWIFSTDLGKIFKYQTSWKSIKWKSTCSMRTDGQAGRQAGRHDGAILRTRLKTHRKKWTFQLHRVHCDGPVAVRDFISGGYCGGGVDKSNTLLKFTVQRMCHLHFLPLLNLANRFFHLMWDWFQVLPAVTTNYAVSRNLALCSLIEIYQYFWSVTSTVSP